MTAMSQDLRIGIRSRRSPVYNVSVPTPEIARHWRMTTLARSRWAPGQLEKVQRDAAQALLQIGLPEQALAEIAAEGVAEVITPFLPDALNVPWEGLLARATGPLRGGRKLVVTRRFVDATAPKEFAAPGLTFIGSAPRWLARVWGFADELLLVSSGLGIQDACYVHDASRNKPPPISEIMHIGGSDAEQAKRALRVLRSTSPVGIDHDHALETSGLVLSDGTPSETGIVCLPSSELPDWLCAGHEVIPKFVALNFFSSFAGAAEMVRHGSIAAIGFFGEIDDAVSESFFASFYLALGSGRNLNAFYDAFVEAWNSLFDDGLQRFVGNGIVFWSSASVLDERSEPPSPSMPRVESAEHKLHVRVEPMPDLNYALLHNHHSFFHEYRILSLSGAKRDVLVTTRIDLGLTSPEHRAYVEVVRPVTNLAPIVRLPLTSPFARSLREAVRTHLQTEVRVGEHIIHQRSHPVTILAIDEWRDTPATRPLLPSFVFPRDPAIGQLVHDAVPYLRTLTDRWRACFVGYDIPRWTSRGPVTLQARALWACLAQKWGLDYVRPPPTFTARSQRIRIPSDLLRYRHGTCLDLTLLFAACLEYIDLKPVIFLAKGHAWVGVWKRLEDFDGFFRNARRDGIVQPRDELRDWDTPMLWQVNDVDEIKELIESGQILSIETTLATGYLDPDARFEQATRFGVHERHEGLECMLDIGLARQNDVTPLPLDAMDRGNIHGP